MYYADLVSSHYCGARAFVKEQMVGVHVWDGKLMMAFMEADSERVEDHLLVLSYELNLRTKRVRLFPRDEYANANWKLLHPTATPIGMYSHSAASLSLVSSLNPLDSTRLVYCDVL